MALPWSTSKYITLTNSKLKMAVVGSEPEVSMECYFHAVGKAVVKIVDTHGFDCCQQDVILETRNKDEDRKEGFGQPHLW